MRKGHILGTTPLPGEAFFSDENLKLMRDCSVKMIRVFLSVPWGEDPDDRSFTDAFKADIATMERMKAAGFEVMPVYPMAAQSHYDKATNSVHIEKKLPRWFGGYDDDCFYENVYAMGKMLGEVCKPYGDWWQIANEPDGVGIMHDFTFPQNVRFLKAAAAGVLAGNPDAKSGINLTMPVELGSILHIEEGYGYNLLRELYRGNPAYYYVGLDSYFGSWTPGEPLTWMKYISDAAEAAGCYRVIISEWGYSTWQKGKPRPEEDIRKNYNSDVCRYKDWDAPVYGTYKWQGKPHSEELQAEYIRQAMMIFADHPYVIGNLFFQWVDQENCWQCGEPDCPAECGWGCIRTDMTPKPGYYALKKAYNEIAEANR